MSENRTHNCRSQAEGAQSALAELSAAGPASRESLCRHILAPEEISREEDVVRIIEKSRIPTCTDELLSRQSRKFRFPAK